MSAGEKVRALGERAFRRKLEKDAFVQMLGPGCGPNGDRIIANIVREGGLMERSAVPGDPILTGFNDGVRSMAVHIIQMAFGAKGSVAKIQEVETENAKEIQDE